jgi:TorA maturation chaperone TorD
MSAVMTYQTSRLERLDGLRKIFLSKSSKELSGAFKTLFPAVAINEEQLEVDFNYYFVGPNKPVAAPYASLYLDEAVLMMSNSTQLVRELYEVMGLVNPLKNKEPEDSLGLELDAYYQLAYIEEINSIDYLYEMRRYFLMQHMKPWMYSFIEQGLSCEEKKSKEIEMILVALKNFLDNEINHEGGKS